MNVGIAPNTAIPEQPHQPSATVSLPSRTTSVTPFPLPTPQPNPPLPTVSTPLAPLLDTLEPTSNTTVSATNLVKPSFFTPSSSSSALMMPPISVSMPTAPPLHPPVTMQRPYGTPLLQPFPPPTPPPSLTPASNNTPAITREKVRDALMKLVQVWLLVPSSSCTSRFHWILFYSSLHVVPLFYK